MPSISASTVCTTFFQAALKSLRSSAAPPGDPAAARAVLVGVAEDLREKCAGCDLYLASGARAEREARNLELQQAWQASAGWPGAPASPERVSAIAQRFGLSRRHVGSLVKRPSVLAAGRTAPAELGAFLVEGAMQRARQAWPHLATENLRAAFEQAAAEVRRKHGGRTVYFDARSASQLAARNAAIRSAWGEPGGEGDQARSQKRLHDLARAYSLSERRVRSILATTSGGVAR